MTNVEIFSHQEIEQNLSEAPEWKISDDEIRATYSFCDFRTAFAFMTIIAMESELKNHHPTLINTYKEVHVRLTTHSKGDKVTNLDIDLARYISSSARRLCGSIK